MMNVKIIKLSALLILIGSGGTYAQDATLATGGDATGAGGSVSYSVGQVSYTHPVGSSGTVAEGVQQPYEIFIYTGTDVKNIQLGLSAYPNPATNYLMLDVSDTDPSTLNFQLLNLEGRLLESDQLENPHTTIELNNFPPGTYFLKVSDKDKAVKTFKIVKNQ